MSHFKNVSSAGDLDLPLLGRVVAADEVFEVTPEQEAALIDQPDVWAYVTETGKSKAVPKKYLAEEPAESEGDDK